MVAVGRMMFPGYRLLAEYSYEPGTGWWSDGAPMKGGYALVRVLVVGIGGFIGASLRYIISVFCMRALGDSFPYGTLFVNALGGFLIGFIMEASSGLWPVSPNTKLFLTTGILGGLTTFSTFSYETINLLNVGSYLLGGLNAGLNLLLSLLGAWMGKLLAQVIG